jgi:hypothetical protein
LNQNGVVISIEMVNGKKKDIRGQGHEEGQYSN